MKRYNRLIKITGCFILLVSMVSSITSCEDNSCSTYPDSNKWINGNGDRIYGEWAVTETRDDGLVIALIRYDRNDTKKVQWISSVLLKEDAYSDLKMLRDRNFKAYWVTTSNFFKQDEFIGLEFGKEHDFTVRRESGTITFHGKVTGTRGSGEFEFTPNQTFMDYIREKGYNSSPRDKGINLFTANITKKYFDDLGALGYEHWPKDRINEYIKHGVSYSFIRDIHALGYKDISPSRLIEFRKHGVSPEFIRGVQQAGFMDISPDKLVEFRKHGVSPEFIRGVQQAGFKNISPDKMIEFRIHGVNGQNVDHYGNMLRVPGKVVTSRRKARGMINRGSLINTEEKGLQLSNSSREISMFPGEWKFVLYPMIHTYDKIELHFQSTRFKAEALFVVEPHSGALPNSQDKTWDTLKQFYKNHTIRPESWVYGEIDGLPSSTYIADYDKNGKKMIEYCTYILNKQHLGMFELHAQKKAFDKIKTDFDSMVQSFKWKNI